MDNCLIVCSRPLDGVPDSLVAAAEDAFIIAVDGGMSNLVDLGLRPAVWVGDGDSASPELKKAMTGVPRIQLPRSKDYSDLEFALNVAEENLLAGAWEGDVILLGAQGGRFDHDVINMIVVQNWLKKLAGKVGLKHSPEVVSIGQHGVWIATMREAFFRQPKGRVFSVFTLDPRLRVTMTGAKYNVKDEFLGIGARGLSNRGLGKDVRIVASSIEYSGPKRRASDKRVGKKSRRAADRLRKAATDLPGPVFVLFPTGD